MALSINRSQKNYLKTVHLNQIGDGRSLTSGVMLDEFETVLVDLAIKFKILAQNNIAVADAINTNLLAESIQFDAVTFFGGTYSIEIKVLDYYAFVDQGVRGVAGGANGAGSPYAFKNLGVSRGFMTAIRKWAIREGLKNRTKPSLKNPIGQEKKAKVFSEANKTTAFAYAVARSIKKKGLKSTKFWTNTELQINKELSERAGEAFEIAIVNMLTNKL